MSAEQRPPPPATAADWAAIGIQARLHGDFEAALPALQRAVALAPDQAKLRLNLALALAGTGDDSGAREELARAAAGAPGFTALRWAERLATPFWAGSEAAIDDALARFAAGLDALEQELAADLARDPAGVVDAVAGVSSFNLHYLPRDTTALQKRFGALLHRAAVGAMPRFARAPDARAPGGRIRVGFVGAFFTRHTVSRYFARFWRELDPARFERWIWHTGSARDAESQASASAVEHYHQTAEGVAALADRIRAARLDVLVFPDVGMDPRQHALAALRAAPVQAALYGHPVTTGLPTMDAFFSGVLLEPAGAEAHYGERLVRLPGLGAAPSAPLVSPKREWLDGLRDGRPLLLCPQNLAKLGPAFDEVLARVVAGCDGRLLLFDRGRSLSERVLGRLVPALERHGVVPERALTVLPACPYPEFLGAIAAADLVLDTPWFSGGATSLDTIAMGTPIVAWEGVFARGRQTAAMLRMAGLPELVAPDADGYVERALRLVRDPDFTQATRAKLRAGRERVFGRGADAAHAFGDALERLVFQRPTAPTIRVDA
jgi:predicted O-linked N-acetylglucosamine transferase (SPINDLY family)